MRPPLQPGSLVSRSEIRVMLGENGKPMSRTRIGEVVQAADFPRCLDVVHPGNEQPIWRRKDIERWQAEHRRGPGRPVHGT